MSEFELSPMLRHYDAVSERERLTRDVGRLERLRSMELIERHLPDPPAVVLDVGGAAGEYSSWLGGRGYETHLVDLVPRHVEQARGRSESEGGSIASCAVGDARSLARGDETVDVVLLMGPLYHLTERTDRLACLAEARRVLRPGGTLVAAAISRYASLLDGLRLGRLAEDPFREMVLRDLESGLHLNPTEEPVLFTTAHFHEPEELLGELAAAELSVRGLYGVEGPGWLLADFEARWADPEGREGILWAARRAESKPRLVGVSAHLLAIAVRLP